LEEQQPSFFGAFLADPVWQSFAPAFAPAFECDWQDLSSSQVVAEPSPSVLSSIGVGVMTVGRALGGAQHADSQAMVREEKVRGSQGQNKVRNAVGGGCKAQRAKMRRIAGEMSLER
jgi:hypothetical protein